MYLITQTMVPGKKRLLKKYSRFFILFLNSYGIFILLLAVLISGCGYNIKNSNSGGKNIICFGDSITYGTGAPDGQDYPSRLAELLKRDVINEGVEGDGTDDALARLDKDVLENDPYLVIVEFGGNDFLNKVPKEVTLNNLGEIISRIQAKGAMVALCDVSSGVILSGYRKDYEALAEETRSIFVPRLLEDILTDVTLKSDEIHPNPRGYGMIAKKVYAAVKRYIK